MQLSNYSCELGGINKIPVSIGERREQSIYIISITSFSMTCSVSDHTTNQSTRMTMDAFHWECILLSTCMTELSCKQQHPEVRSLCLSGVCQEWGHCALLATTVPFLCDDMSFLTLSSDCQVNCCKQCWSPPFDKQAKNGGCVFMDFPFFCTLNRNWRFFDNIPERTGARKIAQGKKDQGVQEYYYLVLE